VDSSTESKTAIRDEAVVTLGSVVHWRHRNRDAKCGPTCALERLSWRVNKLIFLLDEFHDFSLAVGEVRFRLMDCVMSYYLIDKELIIREDPALI